MNAASRQAGTQPLGPAARAFIRKPAVMRPMPTQRTALIDSFDQRELVTLLLLPFFLLAFALAMSQSWRQPVRIAEPRQPVPVVVTPPQAPSIVVEIAPPAMKLPAIAPVIDVPQVELAAPAMTLPVTPPAIEQPPVVIASPRLVLPMRPPVFEIPVIEIPQVRIPAPSLRTPDGPPPFEPQQQAKLALPPLPPVAESTPPPAELMACPASPGFGLHTYDVRAVAAGESFGERLAIAARAQTSQFVIYNDQYRRIAFPMGDVPPMFGVCTDVIIRAYRALGVDLQVLVAKARVGSGDTSIQHRRTETLRRFFASRGQSLAVTSFPEDYQPGDVVSYYRPQNQHSRAHIAIVSDQLAASGRPMIVHNRGWGPQLEDALFVDQMTGHYRFHPKPVEAAAPLVAVRTDRPAAAAGRKTAQLPISRPVQKTAYTPAPRSAAANGAQAARNALSPSGVQ